MTREDHFDGHDPLTVLHDGDLAVQPDPEFAARLRTRLESALSLPHRTGDVAMSGTDTALAELTESTAGSTVPRPAMLPYLAVADARAAVDWYVDALAATLLGDPIIMDDGRIGHAELALSGGVFYLADEYPELGLKAPDAQAVSVSLMLAVPDTDAALRRVGERGATVERDAYEAHGSRTGTIIDPFGHRWMLTGPLTGGIPQIQHGDIGYVSVWTREANLSAAFYGHVLGWRFDPDQRRVTNTEQPIGIFAADGPPTLFCCYAVADVTAARRAILEGGGQAAEITTAPHGPTVEAVDPFGTAFAVYQPVGASPRPALNGNGPGELSYVTFHVGDSGAFRQFYGRVLGWTFEPGHVDDGWEPTSVHPMVGIGGGSAEQVTVPMWTVADVGEAVARVRAAGGSVIEEPSQQSYGLSALCTDDQGTRFYLGQL